jgi:hypothetical protein
MPTLMPHYRVYKRGHHPKPKQEFFRAKLVSHRDARSFCSNCTQYEGLTIVHPCGKEEPYESARYKDGRMVKTEH